VKPIVTILFIFFLLHPALNGQREKDHMVTVIKWVVEPQSHLTINGKSNVNTFQCGITEFLHTDTLVYMNNDGILKPAALKGSVTIDINRFDCGHKYITNDLRKTLKADNNPFLIIRFISMDKINPNQHNQVTKGNVEIELAGVKKQYEINYTLKNGNPQQLQLTGNRSILFSDFHLKPPTRLAGLIKVAGEITVQFQLLLKPV
jgi:YceI-like domain